MKNQKGITLIALVITIIVLLILAGITIAMLTGENGLLTKASGSASQNSVARVKEEIMLEFQKELTDYLETKHTTASTASQAITEETLVKGINGGTAVQVDATSHEGSVPVKGCNVKINTSTHKITITHPATGTAKATEILQLTYNSTKDSYTLATVNS